MNEESQKPSIMVRHGAPNKFDHAIKGTECIVIKENDETDLYIQQGADEENPEWMYMGPLKDTAC